MGRSLRPLLLAGAIWSCSSFGATPEPLFHGTLEESLVEGNATVEAIDHGEGTLSLRHGSRRLVFPANDERVEDLSRLDVGDEVTVAYYEAIVHDIVVHEGEGPKSSGSALAERTGLVVEVDRDMPSLRLREDSGESLRFKVRESAALENIRPGDRVTVQYTPARAVAVRRSK